MPSVAGANLADYTVATTNGSLTVSQVGTATTFALSNSNLTLTATVASLTSGAPTGMVDFYEGQTMVGTGALTNGSASYTAASFPSGDVVVSAQYSGDANFTQSASPPILILSVQPAQTQISVNAAGTATDTLSLTAAAGYAGSVQFSCSGLPQYATCSFSPASITFGASTSASTTLTVQTGVSSAAMRPGFFPSHSLTALAMLIWFPGLCIASFSRRRPRVFPVILLALLAATACTYLSGCGSSPTLTPTGSSTVQVITTGSSGLAQTINLSLSVQ